MKNLFIAALALIAFGSCQNSQPNEAAKTEETSESTRVAQAETSSDLSFYGDTITTEGAIDAETFREQMAGKDSMDVKLEANIIEACKMKGCWMTMDVGGDQDVRVTFKDYGFFVPTEGVDGKTAIIQGRAFLDTLSVAMLQHYAEDGGKSAEEIAAITEPEIELTIEADGVIIRN